MQQLLLGGTQPMSSHAEQVPCDIVDGKDRWACAADLKRRMIGQPLEAALLFPILLMRLLLIEVSCTCCEIREHMAVLECRYPACRQNHAYRVRS